MQAALNPGEVGVVEVDERFAAALDGLAGFDHAWLLSWLGGTEGRDLSARRSARVAVDIGGLD